MVSQHSYSKRWQSNRSTASFSLRLNQVQLATDALKLDSHTDLALVRVDILPGQPKCLSLAKAKRKSNRVQRL